MLFTTLLVLQCNWVIHLQLAEVCLFTIFFIMSVHREWYIISYSAEFCDHCFPFGHQDQFHCTMLPNLRALVYSALATFETPWMHPLELSAELLMSSHTDPILDRTRFTDIIQYNDHCYIRLVTPQHDMTSCFGSESVSRSVNMMLATRCCT